MISKISNWLENTHLYKIYRKIFFTSDGTLRTWTVPVALLAVVGVCYGLYANHMGFYWDDWTYAWTRYFLGYQGLRTTAPDVLRPLRAYIEIAVTPVLGTNLLAWQIYAILLRWIAAVSIWWFLQQVWGGHPRLTFTVALLYAVYPGFSQQSEALTYHYFWIFQAVFYISLGLMVLAIHRPRYFWPAMIGALAGAALQLFSSEYLIGLELLRPFFIWIALTTILPDWKRRLGRTAVYSAPFLLLLGFYLLWRVFIYKFPTYQPVLIDQIRSDPGRGLLGLLGTIWRTFGVVTVGAWENTVQINFQRFIYRFKTIYPLLVVVSVIGLTLYLNRLQKDTHSELLQPDHRRAHIWQFIGVGLVAILVAGIPYYVAGVTVASQFERDRWSLAFILGVGLLLTGLMELLPHPRQSITLAATLAGMAIGLQYYNAALFRSESDLQKLFAWQLTWRMPALKPNTLLVSDNLAFPFTDDEGLTFLVNWIYAPDNHTTHLPAVFDSLTTRLGNEIPALDPGQAVDQNFYKSVDFRGSTDQMVVMYFNPPGCLRVLNPEYDQDLIFLQVYKTKNGHPILLNSYAVPPLVAAALPLSNMDRIIPSPGHPATPPAFLFGSGSSHTWCYFFEKADLARQNGDWQKVASLGDQAFGSQLFAWELSENLVFIEAYAQLGRWAEADKLTQTVSASAPILDPALCAVWKRAGQASQVSKDDRAHIASVAQQLQCDRLP